MSHPVIRRSDHSAAAETPPFAPVAAVTTLAPRAALGATLRRAALATLFAGISVAQTTNPATVYRDENGLAHIVADSEQKAWYALGYEQARDGLLWIQYACKGAKGELLWAHGYDSLVLNSDVAVKVFGAYERLSSMSIAERRALFTPTNPSIQANFYDNCVAFAAGADAYRQAVMNAPSTPASPESALRDWLADEEHNLPGTTHTLAWVFQDPITALDIAAQGAWTNAIMSFRWPTTTGLANSTNSTSTSPSSYVAPPILPETAETAGETVSTGDPQLAGDWFTKMKEQIATLPGAPSALSGSNTFAWSGFHCQDGSTNPTQYPGLLGDPHQGIPSFAREFRNGFSQVANHMWFAHVKVTPPGASTPTLDYIGHFPHAAAAGFTGHNRNVAMGGSLGSPNHIDLFLLRLHESPDGTRAAGEPEYYSYYDDDGANPTNETWRSLKEHEITIKLQNTELPLTYWTADSFGLILPEKDGVVAYLNAAGDKPDLPVVYGERLPAGSDKPNWRVKINGTTEPMRFWRQPELNAGSPVTSPMVVSLRAPLDANVDGGATQFQLMLDFWEMAHANQIADVVPRTNGAAFLGNVCFVDRLGRLFTTHLTAVPERGVDADLAAAEYHSVDKQAIYNKVLPVPARYAIDRMFDWQFASVGPEGPTGLRYLQYSTAVPPTHNPVAGALPTILPFKPSTFQDPTTLFASPPVKTWDTPFQIQSGFFASACNDQIWGFSRKRDKSQDARRPEFSDLVITNNDLLQWTLDAGVAYVTAAATTEAPDRQQIVVQRFGAQAQYLLGNQTSGRPPMSAEDMRKFVVTPELYHDDDYPETKPNDDFTRADSRLPAPIRQLKEIVDNASSPASPQTTALRDVTFLNNLWTALHSGAWDHYQVVGAPGQAAVDVNLRNLWLGIPGNVSGHENQIFWYDTPDQPDPGLRWISMPAHFPLIDFYWPETEIGKSRKASDLLASPFPDSTLAQLVDELINWGPGPLYHNNPDSPGACLLEMMRMGYGASGIYGRHWTPLMNGQILDSSLQPHPLDSSGHSSIGTAGAFRISSSWSALIDVAFPSAQLATLMQPGLYAARAPSVAIFSSPGATPNSPTPQDVNDIVRFFLALGGHYITPSANGGNPSTKLAKYNFFAQAGSNPDLDFIVSFPPTYPLTDGLQRLSAACRLLDAADFVGNPIPPLSRHFRSRAYDHTGQVWPALQPGQLESDEPCVGGSLRAVVWWPDITTAQAEAMRSQGSPGFHDKFLGVGGSIATMLALFPKPPVEPSGVGYVPPVESHFWCTPGVRVMSSDPNRFAPHMNAFATNTLLPTHYDDFLSNVVGPPVTHNY